MSYSAKDDARLQELLDVIVDASGDLAVATHCNAETEIRPARKLIWEQVDALFSHVDGLVNTRPREDALQAEVEVLKLALTALVDEHCDYMLINHLGNPEEQHNIKLARAALKGAPHE